MRSILRGAASDPNNPTPPPPHWREFLIMQMTGWTPQQIDEAPAALTDYWLMYDQVIKQEQAKDEAAQVAASKKQQQAQEYRGGM